jgi:hypothetical protein
MFTNEPTDWRAGCGKSASPVRREGWRIRAIPTPIWEADGFTDENALPKETFSEKETEDTEENSEGCSDGTSLPLFTLNSG